MPKKSTVNSVIARLTSVGGKIASLFTGLLAATLILYSGYVLYDTFYIQNQAFSNGWELLQYRPEIIDDGNVPLSAETLAAINQDYRAWLTIYDTNIDYPVMQGENDLYYASHDYQKKSSLTGALYVASENSPDFSDNYNLIYGHHMDSQALFGGLKNFADTSYFNEHREGILVLPDAVYDLNIFAVIEDDAYNGNIYTVGNRDIAALLQFIQSTNPFQYDAAAAQNATKILAMSTCQSAETNGRLVVFAVMTARNVTGPNPVNPDDPNGNNPANPDNPAAPGGPDGGAPGGGAPGGGAPGGGNPGGGNQGGGNPLEDINNTDTPLAGIIDAFIPAGGVYGDNAWALVNLICLAITIYLFVPLLSLKAKFSRKKMMKEINEEREALSDMMIQEMTAEQREERKMILKAAMEAKGAGESAGRPRITKEEFDAAVAKVYYQVEKFKRRYNIGLILELIVAIGSIVAFILTENMRLPMVLIDKWTPLMLLILLAMWIVDIRLIRYRGDREAEDELLKAAEEAAEAQPQQ